MISVSGGQYVAENRAVPFLCGELHYYRMDPEVWEERLSLLSEAGCNAVASYVPWGIHELEEGEFDFEGRTNNRLNLKLWLELVAKSGLTMLIRPGPLVYTEIVLGGWPVWLQREHPEVESKVLRDGKLVRCSQVSNPEDAAVSYLHPVYLEKAGNWLATVAEIIKPYLQTNGGPISMWQLCNEIPGMQTWLLGMDRSPESIGMGRSDGCYPTFLRDRYGDANKLNAAYGIKCETFDQISWDVLATADQGLVEADYSAFYHEVYVPTYVKWLVDTVRKTGVDVTLTSNAGNPNEVSALKEAARKSPEVLFGVDCYYHIYETALGSNGLAYLCELGASIVSECFSEPATVWEEECGFWFDYPHVEPDDLYLFLMWSYISGYKGLNMYLFGGGDNWPGLGIRGNYHEYQAPIASDGSLRPNYDTVKRATADILADPWILQSERVCDLSVGIYSSENLRNLAHFLFESSVSYDVVDVRSSSPAKLSERPIIWLRGREEMDVETQQTLLDYVAGGGKLIIDQTLPTKQADHSPARVLSRALGIEIQPNECRVPRIKIANTEILIDQAPGVVASEGEVLASDVLGQPAVVGVRYGSGQVVVAPFDVTYRLHSQVSYIDAILAWFGVDRIVSANRIRGQVRKENDGATFVYLANPYREPVREEVIVSGQKLAVDLSAQSIEKRRLL